MGRVEDDVCDDLIRMKGSRVDIEGGVFVVEADGGGVDDDIGVAWDLIVRSPRQVVGLCGGVGVDEVGQFGATNGVAIHNEEVGSVGEGEFHGDGAGCASSAEDEDGLIRGICEGLKGSEEAFAISVLANELVASADDAIDGAHEGCGLAEAIEEGNNADLMRDGKVKALKAQCASAENCSGKIYGCDFHVDVAPRELELGEGGFDHGDGGVAVSTLGHGADEMGAEGGHGVESES